MATSRINGFNVMGPYVNSNVTISPTEAVVASVAIPESGVYIARVNILYLYSNELRGGANFTDNTDIVYLNKPWSHYISCPNGGYKTLEFTDILRTKKDNVTLSLKADTSVSLSAAISIELARLQ